MKVKTSELIDHGLDWAVAKSEGIPERLVFGRGAVCDTGYYVEHPNGTHRFYVLRNVWDRWFDKCETHPWGAGVSVWSPSTNWSQGGPIIEREKIATWTPMTIFARRGGPWVAGIPAVDEYGDEIEIDQEYYGPTPLVAAMRCYVGSKLGDEVEIPDELMQ